MITLGHRMPAADDLVGHLLECHGRIRSFIGLAAKAGASARVDAEVVDACTAVERYFELALPLHVEDEEHSVLPRLRGVRSEIDEALRTMQDQHRTHGPLIEQMLAASRSLRQPPGEAGAGERLRLAALRLAAELEPHLALEERIIFPAVKLLDAETQARVRIEQRTRRNAASPRAP